MTLREKYDRLGFLNAEARKVINACDEAAGGANKGVLSAQEQETVDNYYAEYDKIEAEIKADERQTSIRKRLDEQAEFLNQSAGRISEPQRTVTTGDGALELKFRGQVIKIDSKSPLYHRATPAYNKAYADYLAFGVNAGLQTTNDTKGGYLAPTQMAYQMITALDDEVVMRQLATVLPPLTQSTSLGVPTLDTDPNDADWTAEVPASALTEDDNMALGKRELTPHLLTKYVLLSQKILRVGAIPADLLVNSRLRYKFVITEDKGFLTGTGHQQPLGVFTASDDGVSTTRDVTCAATNAFTADEVIDTLYNLKAGYMNRATWLVHRGFVKRCRQLKDGNQVYIWAPGLAMDRPATLVDRPYIMCENAPNTYSASQYVAIVGDFKAGYWIVDSLDLEIQRLNELKALQNQVGFVGRKETDGMPVLAEAFSRMKLAAQ